MSSRRLLPKPAPRRLDVAIVLAALLSFGLAWSIAHLDRPSAPGQAELPFLLIIGTAAAIFWVERIHRRLGFFTPLAIGVAGYVLMFAVVPLADMANGHPLSHHDAWWMASWYAWFGLLTFYGGYRLALVVTGSRHTEPGNGWLPARERAMAMLLLGAAAVSFVLLLNHFGGPSAYVSVFRRRTLLLQRHVLLLVGIGLATPALLVRVGGWLNRPSRSRLVLMLAVWLPPSLLLSGFLGARFRVAGIVVALLAAYHLGHRRIRLPILCLLAAALAWLFVIAGVERNYVGSRQAAPAITRSNFYDKYLVTHDLGEFREFVITMEGVPRVVDFQHGRTFLSVIPGVPVPTGGQLYSSVFFGAQYSAGTSISPSLPGELYMNFGLPGILWGMALFGLLVGLLEAYYRRNRERIGAVLLYSFSLVPVALELRGDFTSMTSFYLAGAVPLVVAARWIQQGSVRPIVGTEQVPWAGGIMAPTGLDGGGAEPLGRIR
jgi:hypothetical protein